MARMTTRAKLACLLFVVQSYSTPSPWKAPYAFTQPGATVVVDGREGTQIDVPIDVVLNLTAAGLAHCRSTWVIWFNGAVLYEQAANRTDARAGGLATIRTSIGADLLYVDGGDTDHSLALSCGRRGSRVSEHRFRLSSAYTPHLVVGLSAPGTADIDVAVLDLGLTVDIDARAFAWDIIGGGYVTLNGYEIGTIDSPLASLLIPAWALRAATAYALTATLLSHQNEPVASRTVRFRTRVASSALQLRFDSPSAELVVSSELTGLTVMVRVVHPLSPNFGLPGAHLDSQWIYPPNTTLRLHVDGILLREARTTVFDFALVRFEAEVDPSRLADGAHALSAVLTTGTKLLAEASVRFHVYTPRSPLGDADSLGRTVARVASASRDVAIVMTNDAFVDLTLNLLCGASKVGFSELVVWATDSTAYAKLKARGVSVVYEESLSSDADVSSFGSTSFNLLTHLKTKVVHAVLKLGYNVLLLDADISILAHPFAAESALMRAVSVSAADMLLQNGNPHNLTFTNRHQNYNTGMYYTRSTAHTLAFMTDVMDVQRSTARLPCQLLRVWICL
jgi:hypothetical protein